MSPISPLPPWTSLTNIRFISSHKNCTKRTDPPERRRNAAEHTIKELPQTELQIWTDGSANSGTEDGGSGILIYKGSGEKRIRLPAGKRTSSFHAELVALEGALRAVQEDEKRICTIFTDSQSAVKHLENGPEYARTETVVNVWRLMQRINESGKQVIIVWVPGHAGLEGNEKVDEIAKEATPEDQRSAKVPQGAAESSIHRHCTKEWIKEVHQGAADNPYRR